MADLTHLTPSISKFIRSARVAHLASADGGGRPHVIPVCFAFDGKYIYSPIDEKPKRTAPAKLKRLKNIAENPYVALVVDRYDEDWQKLAYMLIIGTAKILHWGVRHASAVRRLRRKYPQYRRMDLDSRPVIQMTPVRWVTWGQIQPTDSLKRSRRT